MTDVDVAIVGGGISGLAVADGLIRSGMTVQVFEARPRLGGRIESLELGGGHADLGPTWFWPGEHRVDRLVRELGLAVHEQWTSGDALVAANGQVSRVASFGVPASFRFSGGSRGLIDGLASRLPEHAVSLACEVTSVERGLHHPTIQTHTGTVSARAVVIAMPPSLALSRGVIDPAELDPGLLQTASSVGVWMGAITKAVAVYAQPFWRDAGLSGMVNAFDGPFREIHDTSGPDGTPGMLFGFGHSQPRGPALTTSVFVEQLTTLFGPDAASPLGARAIDWRQEPFTTPAEWPLSSRYDLFGSPLLQEPTWNRQLYWTSTETSTVAPGHIEGALAAAERTIRALACDR